MGLLDLKTDLKSLRYGQDTPGGGDSGQPYIKSKIPEGLTSKSPDFLLRNGYLAPRDALTDVARLTKMFFDLKSPNGLLFTAKQNVLSATAAPAQGGTFQAPRLLNEYAYTPLSTLAQAGVVAGGGHLNKQGVNPFADTGAYAKNPNLYFDKAKTSNIGATNRITTQTVVTQANTITVPLNTAGTQFDVPFSDIVYGSSNPLGDDIFQTSTSQRVDALFTNRLASLWYDKVYTKTGDANVLSYRGGPGSVLGVGTTNIRFADQRTGINSNKKINGNTTWTPNQEINREFTTLIGKETAIGASKAYATTNQLALDNDTVDGTRVYVSKVGPDAKLFNPLATSFITWTANTQISRSFADLQRNLFKKGVSRTLFDLESPYNKNYSGLPDNSGDKVYIPGQVGLNAKLFNPNATGPVTWTPNQETLNSTDNLRRLISQSPTSRKFNLLLSGSNNDIPLSDLTPPSVYEQGPNQTILNNNDKILYANGSATYTQKQIEESPYGKDNPPLLTAGVSKDNDSRKTGAPKLQDFRRIIRENSTLPKNTRETATKNGSLAESLNYTSQNYEKRVNIGGKDNAGPGNNTSDKNLSKGLLTSSGIGPIDKINALPIYRSENGVATNSEEELNFGDTKNIKAPVNDLIAFRIAAINSSNPSILDYMHFRAFIDNFDDSYTADWGSTKYVGRGETFYNYNGFDRNISLGFTVVAQSLEELNPMYTKLNYLASNLTPDYSEFGYMRGPLIKLTVGKYLIEQVGFIKSLSYSIPQETPWDINNEMPFMIKINSFSFVPIQSFRPSKQELTFNKARLTETGNQKYISFPNIIP